MYLVDGHRFSPTDARRTVTHALAFLAAYPAAAQAALVPRRERIAELVAGIDVDGASEAALGDAVAAVWRELGGARDDVRSAGARHQTVAGSVAHLHISDGGVPKSPVGTVDVDMSGVVGDRQASRRHHGSPFQSLCLWSVETIDSLAADGHPIAPGRAGENITLEGVDVSRLPLGTRLQIGSVVCDISGFAVPCAKNAQWFSDRDVSRIHHDNGALSRMYATVRRPGTISIGDPAVVEPDVE